MQEIKAIIFDAGGVLQNGHVWAFVEKSSKILGIEARPVSEACFNAELNAGRISHHKAFEEFFGVEISGEKQKELEKVWSENWPLNPEMLELVKSLKQNYKVALLSNTDTIYEELHWKTLEKQGLFDIMVLSHKVHLVKPDIKIFELTLERLGLKGEECVFVDDAIENKKPCDALGIKFIHFNSPEQCKKELLENGIRTEEKNS